MRFQVGPRGWALALGFTALGGVLAGVAGAFACLGGSVLGLALGSWRASAAAAADDLPAFTAVLRELREAVEGGDPPGEVAAIADRAMELVGDDLVRSVLVELEVARCRALEGEVGEELRDQLVGLEALARRMWGDTDDTASAAAEALGVLHWTRARICREQDGVVDFHDADAARRVGRGVIQDLGGEDPELEGFDPDDDSAIRAGSYALHWWDLAMAERYLRRAADALAATHGRESARAAGARSLLAQVLAVNQAPERSLQLASEALRDLGVPDHADPARQAMAYEALGLAYHVQGKTAEARIYLDRADALMGDGEDDPTPAVLSSPSHAELPSLEGDPAGQDLRVHLPESGDPIIH
jgi:tetratricopeptide (TPR) repeat protein